MYNTRIVREAGGSELYFASGASLNFGTGAMISGTIGGNPTFSDAVTLTQDSGSSIRSSGTLTTYQVGACLSFNVTGPSQTTLFLNNGTSKPAILVGRDKPVVYAPQGSLYLRASGSMSDLYIQVALDTPGSTWVSFNRTSALA
jgi:hypothetical protein